jgi:hypothetical protein
VTCTVEVWRTVTVVFSSESRDNVIVVGIVTSTVTVCSDEVLPSSRCRAMVDVVITAVVVRVVSNDRLVVKVNAPADMTAGY